MGRLSPQPSGGWESNFFSGFWLPYRIRGSSWQEISRQRPTAVQQSLGDGGVMFRLRSGTAVRQSGAGLGLQGWKDLGWGYTTGGLGGGAWSCLDGIGVCEFWRGRSGRAVGRQDEARVPKSD
ncbi:hypothetical protein RchiOBHm_Chr4g0396961 [Rosa chinensis]|uniref:Uncharacterized protein n=1 Tax=Rosa chinensis TaxID=74649 RepID=A0A2P6QRX0_ROSCH|nr:hypothetical protein RchiOBHm_Chr4g0396961 [Rosa chinensis]